MDPIIENYCILMETLTERVNTVGEDEECEKLRTELDGGVVST